MQAATFPPNPSHTDRLPATAPALVGWLDRFFDTLEEIDRRRAARQEERPELSSTTTERN